MKSILLHGPAADAAGLFCDAGATLDITQTGKAGSISADEAKRLVSEGRAIDAAKAPAGDKAEA